MKKSADYIKQVEIDSLWNGRKHILWDLRPDVNILSGVNGMGKSTILNRIVRHLSNLKRNDFAPDGVRLTFDQEDADYVLFDVVRSIDRPVVSSEILNQFVTLKLQTELDIQLYMLQRRYLDYQVNLGNRMVALFTSNDPDAQQKAAALAAEKAHFHDIVDRLFKDTGKTIVRDSNEILLNQYGEHLAPYSLSSGEKQMLIILITVLVQDKQHYVLFMDEPEVSLHIEWQQQLVGIVRELNPNVQVILTTHSPALIMDGWQDCVTDVEDIEV